MCCIIQNASNYFCTQQQGESAIRRRNTIIGAVAMAAIALTAYVALRRKSSTTTIRRELFSTKPTAPVTIDVPVTPRGKLAKACPKLWETLSEQQKEFFCSVARGDVYIWPNPGLFPPADFGRLAPLHTVARQIADGYL